MLFLAVGKGCPFHIRFGIMDHISARKYSIFYTLWGNCEKPERNYQKRNAASSRTGRSQAYIAEFDG